MSLIKKIDSYVLKRFFTLFLMTFFIVIFILLMQFLWKHFSDLVGKGIGWSVLGEFFMYAVTTLVPLALPLALLLASLMTFGNLGENFELTAMKSAGISLFRIMTPLVIFIAFVVVGAFYFSNNVLPLTQKNMYTLMYSIKNKSPELDIPTGEFYSGISGVNLYVRGKDKALLKDLMIYDFTNGFNNAAVLVADSGRIEITPDKKHILLILYDGESFENLKKQLHSENIPYRRETFAQKEMLIDFDSDFNRYDASLMQDQHVSKNITELSHSIDSVKVIIAERSKMQVDEMLQTNFFRGQYGMQVDFAVGDTVSLTQFSPDSAFYRLNNSEMEHVADVAVGKARSMLDQVEYNKVLLGEPLIYLSRHSSEWHKKFALSFACLIFFFIGAPLGAIIRKGGFGLPVVISVLMFVIYYIIDLTGFKMAREGIWEAYQGMWLSTAILLPVGVFLTYKAAVDASLFNREMYIKFFHTTKIKIYTFLRISIDNEEETLDK